MSKILIAGDFCQEYRVDGIVKEKRFGELFDEVKPIIESVDYSIVNFEFPIILDKNTAMPIPKCGPNLQGTIEAVDAVKYVGFKCCTLANNHILDQGEQCCIDTKLSLEQAGIDTVGVGCNLSEASDVLYKVINGETIAIINCCEHEFSIATESEAGANPLNPICQYYAIQEAKKQADYVLVIVHGGHEYFQLPSPRMQETYRFFIGAGADAVINHHQHCYSGYEVYNGKPIFYGLGNFCFDAPKMRNDIWNEGYMVIISFDKQKIACEIIPYTQCNEKASVELVKDRTLFDKNIEKLNAIIQDPKELKKNVDEYYRSTASGMLLMHQPYENRILNKLYRMHLLPSLVSRQKYLKLLNYIYCEAHHDKHVFAFKQLFR
ncbi:CapA family protein [Parabacteroides distasonis]|nr:CapA family protein [Parabacteroides distasonis]